MSVSITGTDGAPATPDHNAGCDEWCNHCALCGVRILWGSRCMPHLGVYPDRKPVDSGAAHEG